MNDSNPRPRAVEPRRDPPRRLKVETYTESDHISIRITDEGGHTLLDCRADDVQAVFSAFEAHARALAGQIDMETA